MSKLTLFKKTRQSVARKMNNRFYVDVINSHNRKLIKEHFTLLELIFIVSVLRKIDSMSDEKLDTLKKEK